jgi:hypothetical protein
VLFALDAAHWHQTSPTDIIPCLANLAYLATQGILLDNYYSITHPSQPNYVAAAGASTHGVIADTFTQIDADVLTIVDLLEAAGISWSLYEEDMPYSGFEADYVNQVTGANDYVRKHKYVFFFSWSSSQYALWSTYL